MKIYFSAAIIYQNERKSIYERIKNLIKKDKCELLTYKDQPINDIRKQTIKEFSTHYKSVIKWINSADMIIIEASFPSTIHIGHEISLALEKNKPVIVLYEENCEPFFLQGVQDDNLFLAEYTKKNLEIVIKENIKLAKKTKHVRFNIMIEPNLFNFIKNESKKNKLSKAEYMRKLVRKDKKEG